MSNPTFVNGSAFADGAGGIDIAAPAIAVATGNTILVELNHYSAGGGAFNGVTDTAGNTYERLCTGGGDSSHVMEIWVAYNAIAHATNIITATIGDGFTAYAFRAICVAQYNDLPAGKLIGNSVYRLTPSGTTHATNTISTGVIAAAFLIGFWNVWDSNRTVTSSGGTTVRVTDTSTPNVIIGDRAVTPAGSYSTQIASNIATQYVGVTLAFDTTAGGGGGPALALPMTNRRQSTLVRM